MKEDLEKLYTQVIKAHNDAPFHFTKIENAPAVVKAINPICGDRFQIYLDTDLNRINAIHFHGFGCAISKASTSVMAKKIYGKKLQEAISICDNFLKFINKELKGDDLTLSDDFLAFSGVHDFPERYECATLSWREVKVFLEQQYRDEN
jgi:nitrogen fixation NifU-like protein